MMKCIAAGAILAGNLFALAAFPKVSMPAPLPAAPLTGRVFLPPAAPDTTLPDRYRLLMMSLLVLDGGALLLYITLRKGAPAKA